MTIPARQVLSGVWQGKTLTRSSLNARLAQEPALNGLTVDLGGGGKPSYLSILKINGSFVNIDKIKEANPTIVGDIEQTFPIASASVDNALLFNTLEHVYSHQHVISEMRRILKPGGRGIVFVPFLFPIHTHETEQFLVDDYFRYSESSLRRIFESAGFSDIKIEPVGGAFLVIAEYLGFILPISVFKITISSLALLLQKAERFRPLMSAKKFPLAYFVVASA